jgi:hypothetical protein
MVSGIVNKELVFLIANFVTEFRRCSKPFMYCQVIKISSSLKIIKIIQEILRRNEALVHRAR